MTVRLRVTCTKKDGPDADRRIDGIGGATGGKDNGPWYLPEDDAIAGIENGTWDFYVVVNQREVGVMVRQFSDSKRKFLTTEADSYPPNNLLNLPDCR